MSKLRAIKEFRVWLDDPLSNTAVRWDAHYQAFVAYCQEHQEMPPWKYITPNEPKLNLEAWVDNQKKRYKGKGTGTYFQYTLLSRPRSHTPSHSNVHSHAPHHIHKTHHVLILKHPLLSHTRGSID